MAVNKNGCANSFLNTQQSNNAHCIAHLQGRGHIPVLLPESLFELHIYYPCISYFFSSCKRVQIALNR